VCTAGTRDLDMESSRDFDFHDHLSLETPDSSFDEVIGLHPPETSNTAVIGKRSHLHRSVVWVKWTRLFLIEKRDPVDVVADQACPNPNPQHEWGA